MIKNILLALFAFVVLALIAVWILNRGPQRIFAQVKGFSLLDTASSSELTLPWKPANIFPFIDEEDLFGPKRAETVVSPDPLEQFRDIEKKYDEIAKDASSVMRFGDPSPHFGVIHISGAYSNPQTSELREEYLVIEAHEGNTAPISLAGWSVQSALTGFRAPLPPAAPLFRGGVVNNVYSIALASGESAIVASGDSPLGISFRENICTGYLSQFQPFSPPLSLKCPSPHGELPLTPENFKTYGDACFDFLNSIPTCEFPKQIPSNSPSACRSFLQNTLSYNGCISRYSARSSLSRESWRLFLGSREPLWRDEHDIIRLLDGEGQTVDVFSY